MAHPFYGDYKKANYDVNKSLDRYIQQAAQLASNQRIVNKQQKEAKDRLQMELDSVEKRFNRTEDRLDTALADAMKTSSVNRKINLATNRRAEDLHPIAVDAARADLAYKKAIHDYKVDEVKYTSKKIKDEYLDSQAEDLIGKFIDSKESLFSQEGLLDKDGNINNEKALETAFQTYNNDQIDEMWNEFSASNEDAANRMGKANFVEKWKKMELRRTEAQWTNIGLDLEAWASRNGLSRDEVMDELAYTHGDKKWFDRYEAMMALNPDTTYTAERDLDGSDWAVSDKGSKVGDSFRSASAKSDGLSYDEAKMYDNLKNFYSHNTVQKALNGVAKAFDQTTEVVAGNLKVDGSGNFQFEEYDAGFNDYWTGNIGTDGKVYWTYNGTNKYYTTDQMLRQTEGAFTRGTATSSSSFEFEGKRVN